MKYFDFRRFADLLVRVLEICTVASLALLWAGALLGIGSLFLSRGPMIVLPSAVEDTALNFSLLCIVLLLLGSVWSVATRRPRAKPLAIRTLIYFMMLSVVPHRMGGAGPRNTQRPNQTFPASFSFDGNPLPGCESERWPG